MLCELLGLGLDLAFGSVTSESESVLHSMSLSVSLLYDNEMKAFHDWIKIRLYTPIYCGIASPLMRCYDAQ